MTILDIIVLGSCGLIVCLGAAMLIGDAVAIVVAQIERAARRKD